MTTVIGLDASLTGSALVVLDQRTAQILYVNTFSNDLEGTTRLAYLKTEILSEISNFGKDDVPIFIEGYGFSFRGCDFKLAELGGVLRLGINESLERTFIEVPPTTLKMFITGKGNAAKNIMLEQVYRKYKVGSEVLKDDNQVDAYALARFGIAFCAWSANPKKFKGTQKELESFKKIPPASMLNIQKAYRL